MIRRISPELDSLKKIAEKKIKENHNRAMEIIKSEEPLTKIIGKEIGRAIVDGPKTFVNDIEEISVPLRSIAEKTVEAINEKKDPISQKASEIINDNPIINPVNIVDKTEEAIKTYSSVVSNNVDEIGKEVTKTVVKEKTKNIVKNGFLQKINNFFKKIVEFFKLKFRKN